MDIFSSMGGMVSLEIVSADIPALLAGISDLGIEFYQASVRGDLTLEFLISRRDWPAIQALCQRRGERVTLKSRLGLYWLIKGILKRPVLLTGLGLLLFLTFFLPTRVLFARVEGNENIPSALILEAARSSGIHFGASRRTVRSQQVKNDLLESIPELKWVGVNTYGCVAVISVRERAKEQNPTVTGEAIAGIVAVREGIILSATATHGTCLCQPGQAVTKGQLLISGYTDLGITITGTRAEGEIIARTRHNITAVTPSVASVRVGEATKKVRYILRIGKKHINLWKGSGIWEASCGRMYEEYHITLPGGFQLPITLLKETLTITDTVTTELAPEELQPLLTETSERQLLSDMISGTIIHRGHNFTAGENIFIFHGEYLCTEMIGRLRQEGIGE